MCLAKKILPVSQHSSHSTVHKHGNTRQMSSSSNVAVTVRVRPLNSREKKEETYEYFKRSGKTTLTEYTDAGQPKSGTTNDFDHVFGPDETTDDLFDSVAKPIVDSALGGVNGTIFAYGQTSSGKTFTMNGDETMDFPGILPLSALHIFDTIEHRVGAEFLVRVSFVEIYNEIVTDLLNPDAGQIKIRESRERGVFVESTETIVRNCDDLMKVFMKGSKSRHVGSTSMNERSSRSHTIFRITIESKQIAVSGDEMDDDDDDDRRSSSGSTASNVSLNSNDDISGAVLVSTLSLVDLAGSENARNTGAKGVRLREGGNINKSLLTLSGVIQTLSANKGKSGGHVRFRDSKLTRLLQPSLVGNCRTSVICCVTPAAMHAEETRSTLRFATSAKTLTTQTKVNEVLDDAAMIKRLKKELLKLKSGIKHHGNPSASDQESEEKAFKDLEDQNRKFQEENEQLRLKRARMQEIARLFLGGNMDQKKNQHHSSSRDTRRKKRETWCPSDVKKFAMSNGGGGGGGSGTSSVGLSMMGVVSELDESRASELDESSDISMDASMECHSAKKLMGGGGGRNVNHTIDISSLVGGKNLGGKSGSRFSFGGSDGGGSGSSSSRRMSFGGESQSSSHPRNLHSEVIRAKGAKITSQEQRLRQLERELESAKKKVEQTEEQGKRDREMSEQSRSVTEKHQRTIDRLTSENEQHEQTVSVLRDERDVAVAARTEQSEKCMSLSKKNEMLLTSVEECKKITLELEERNSVIKRLEEEATKREGETSMLREEMASMREAARNLEDQAKLEQAATTFEGRTKLEEETRAQQKQIEELQETVR